MTNKKLKIAVLKEKLWELQENRGRPPDKIKKMIQRLKTSAVKILRKHAGVKEQVTGVEGLTKVIQRHPQGSPGPECWVMGLVLQTRLLLRILCSHMM